jgi:SAM-dependent methyltransferase
VRIRTTEAPSSVWNIHYKRGNIPWRGGGLSQTAFRLLDSYAGGKKLLEVGCGSGEDACRIADMGFNYVGLDISSAAVELAKSQPIQNAHSFVRADFFSWSTKAQFDVVYEKGFFHGLGGVLRRNKFVRRVAKLLSPQGIWVTVCGSADRCSPDFPHGAIYLRDLVGPAEIYFEVLEIVKSSYGLADQHRDFDAWHAVFRRRNS